MNLWGAPVNRLRVISIAVLGLVALVPWVVEWIDFPQPFHFVRAFLNSSFVVFVVVVALAFARSEIRLRREAEERYKVFIDNAPMGMCTLDREGRFSYANRKFLGISGYRPDELFVRTWRDVVLPEDRPVMEKTIAETYRGEAAPSGPLEVRALHRNKSMLHLILHYAVLERAGKPEHVLIAVQDVTRRRNLEAQLLKSERLAVAGQLAMGLAHEINNPLSIIKTSLRLLKDRGAPGHDIDDTLGDIGEEVDRIAEMVRALMGFRDARPGEEEVTEVDDALQSLLHLMSPQIKKREVKTYLSWRGEKASAAIRPGQFRQIFFNLILNALDAMPSGGTIHLTCEGDDGAVFVRVEDSGCGISLRDQQRLYEPFFSTKSSSHHGLGLYVCYTILKSVSGDIDVDSQVGEGSIFTVRIPQVLVRK